MFFKFFATHEPNKSRVPVVPVVLKKKKKKKEKSKRQEKRNTIKQKNKTQKIKHKTQNTKQRVTFDPNAALPRANLSQHGMDGTFAQPAGRLPARRCEVCHEASVGVIYNGRRGFTVFVSEISQRQIGNSRRR